MQRPRIYTPDALRTGITHTLPASAAVHVTRALRLAAGDPITLFDGSGVDYDAVLRLVARGGVSAEVGEGRRVERESPLAVTLLQGVSRGPRMDLVIQKATELGVRMVQPVLTERSVVRLDAERGQARLDHWRRIVISACEQCGRAVLPADPGIYSPGFADARHPRTAVGVRADGRILLVAVDGRQPELSVGMTIAELASLLRELGAVEAVNMDGGGSTTMVIRARVVNSPSDLTGERPVGDALLVSLRSSRIDGRERR